MLKLVVLLLKNSLYVLLNIKDLLSLLMVYLKYLMLKT